MSTKYYLPSFGGQVEMADSPDDEATPYQAAPLLNWYSPRLFGAPPQLTKLNDMRLMSANPNKNICGPVGDFYLTHILQEANIANFVVGRAIFTGGMSSIANVIRVAGQYAYAMTKYDIFDKNGAGISDRNVAESVAREASMKAYNTALANEDDDIELKTASSLNLDDLDGNINVIDINELGDSKSLLESIGNILDAGAVHLTSSILTSLSVSQPFYTFESDWYTYINNVKMMINSAVIMLGLQSACVRIGDQYLPIGMDVNVKENTDVWSMYRFMTPNEDTGTVTGIDSQVGDTSQYVSFMIEPSGVSESYTNSIGESQLFGATVNKGSSIGTELAFLTNASVSKLDDTVINLAGEVTNVAQELVSTLGGGIGRFTASIAGSMARSFMGDHTIYPKIYQASSSTSSQSITIHLSCDGDPYSYLTRMLVPLFFILGMGLPKLSKNNAAAYQFPPIIQCNIPGLWGTRLGMVESISITKNSNGKDISVHGFPLSIDVTISICDLQHVLVTSPMDEISTFLNNATMFDYIAQMAGVDKFRVNGSIRLVTRLALASSALGNGFHNLKDALLNDWSSIGNRLSGVYRL